jgi:2-keto-4-pentenoate hydratase/2-oxohepta-3-ene-1,7-dioic acid hydratase in catechol pathway
MGPWITTADEIPDPQRLALSCRVNGMIKQESNTSNQIFSVAQVISTLSSVMTLEPGDVIATGIIEASKSININVPLVIRLEGTNVELGKKILAESNLKITSAQDMEDAAKKVTKFIQ